MAYDRLVFRVHAIQRMFRADRETIIVTMYEPHSNQWTPDFKRRKTP
jgi:hypothetical protein